MIAPQKGVRYRQFAFHKWRSLEAETIVETPVSLTVNGDVWLTFMCTPVQLEAMAVGFLFNEGLVEGKGEIVDVRVCEHGDNVDVWLDHEVQQPASWRRTSGCSGGMTAVDALARSDVEMLQEDVRVPAEAIGRLVTGLFDSQELYRETGGVHTSAMSDGHAILVSAEDIGRHNTLDKIAGLCLLGGIWPETRILMTTGRISSEMLQKAARMRTPILISRTSPSSLSIEMAERYGVTLIGYARRDRFNVYTAADRIVGSGDDGTG